jgi:hypothetical protein
MSTRSHNNYSVVSISTTHQNSLIYLRIEPRIFIIIHSRESKFYWVYILLSIHSIVTPCTTALSSTIIVLYEIPYTVYLYGIYGILCKVLCVQNTAVYTRYIRYRENRGITSNPGLKKYSVHRECRERMVL